MRMAAPYVGEIQLVALKFDLYRRRQRGRESAQAPVIAHSHQWQRMGRRRSRPTIIGRRGRRQWCCKAPRMPMFRNPSRSSADTVSSVGGSAGDMTTCMLDSWRTSDYRNHGTGRVLLNALLDQTRGRRLWRPVSGRQDQARAKPSWRLDFVVTAIWAMHGGRRQ